MSEYNKVKKIASQNSSFVIHTTPSHNGSSVQYSNALLSGISDKKSSLLLQFIDQHRTEPVLIITDRQKSPLYSRISGIRPTLVVNDSPQSGYYNFFRNKTEPEIYSLFLQMAYENHLFSQRQVESEQLLKCIIKLAMLDVKVFETISDMGLNGNTLVSQTEQLYHRGLLGDITMKNLLIADINSSISAALFVKALLDDFAAILKNMTAGRQMIMPFSIFDILNRKKHVVFCLDGNMYSRNYCWYLARYISFDLQNSLSKTNQRCILILDMLDREKIELFTSFFGATKVSTVLNINDTDFLKDNNWASKFNDFYIFSHIDPASLMYWQDFFGKNRVINYSYSQSKTKNNKFPLLPLFNGVFGETQDSTGMSYNFIDRNVFEANDIRNLRNNECIYYNHSQRRHEKVQL